jgi:hypothetical protein
MTSKGPTVALHVGVLHTLLNANPYWSSVGLKSTALAAVPGPMSSSNQQLIVPCFMSAFSQAPVISWPKFRDILKNVCRPDC